MTTSRLLFAAAFASVWIVLIFAVGFFWMFKPVDAATPSWASVSHGLFFIFMFGWPVAFLVVLLLGQVGRQFIGSVKGKWRAAAGILSAGAIGAILPPLVWGSFWGKTNDLLPLIPIGAAAGIVGGVFFWLTVRSTGR